MTTRLFSLVPLLLALAGCAAVGPDYAVPEQAAVRKPAAAAPFAQAGSGSGDAQRFVQDEPPGDWWRLYQDPRLDALVGQALAANTDLRQAAANLERTRAVADEARSQQRPGVGVNASPSYGHVSGIQELQPDARPRNQWSYSSGISVSYQLDLFGQIRRAVEAADADTQAAQAAYDAARVTVVAETARAYADLCAAGMQLASARHSADVQRQSLDAVRRLQTAGRGTALDVSRARAQLEQLQAEVPPFQARQRTALYQLAALTGHAPGEMPQSLLTCAQPPRLAQAIPVGDGASLLRRRPDIRQAERALAAATARIGMATADLYPKITLGLNGGSAGPASMFGDRGTFSWSIAPLISWTVPDTGAAQSRIAQAEAGTRGALARFDATVLNALRETESALVSYARQLDRDASLQAARDQSATAADQARRLFQAGKTDYLTVLDAERTLAGAESALAASRAALSTDQVALFLALGGGWQDTAKIAGR
ncbi:efflux transporter outer membrane subunit [Bordetella genomosp. 13]|uniref:RND transporter n=1 Tax=Bordetella genomosp. 13 TaxID=463040 RepID=A0A1W6ZKX9_9BORD|nr:TolC family protein [Bordetella genomosp. 13]ARP97454.1 RND transporter [Bordetella genomosp. 13]